MCSFEKKKPYEAKINYKHHQELQKQGEVEVLRYQRGETFHNSTQNL